MATSVVLGTRPDWTRSTLGIPIETIVRIHPGSAGAKPDLAYSRNRVSVSRVPGAAARPEDEYDVGYVYGAEATDQDVAARSLLPLLRKFVDGYNVAVMAFGATGSGKTLLLEGSNGKERNSSEGNGIVHIAVDEIFKLLNEKAVFIGNALTERRRMSSARAFDFFLESSFVELYREEVYDAYGKLQATRPSLQIYEDMTEGYQVSGLTYRISKTADELRTAYNGGRVMRDTTKQDVGNVQDRAAAIFTIHLAQYSPAAGPGEEDRILVSKIQFVDLPGSERLAEDPEILRLREGPILNRSLHALGATLRSLAEGPGGGLAAAAAAAAAAGGGGGGDGGGSPRGGVYFSLPIAVRAGGGPAGAAVGSGVPFVNYEASTLTKLLADALGGNSLCLIAGTLRQSDGSSGLQAINTLQYLNVARAVRNFPVINHGRSRGLIQKLRYRLMAVVEDRQALRDLIENTPADGDPSSMALHIAKLRDLEARLLAIRSENAELREEKQALQARLEKLHQVEEGELEERQELQDALIQSEEQRLLLARALIDFQMEYNEARQEWETLKYELEAQLIAAEARDVDDEGAEEDTVGERKAAPKPSEERPASRLSSLAGEPAAVAQDATDKRRTSPSQELKAQERCIAELQVELAEVRRELEALRSGALVNQVAADEVRETYRRKLQGLMRDVSALGDVGGAAEGGPEGLLRALQTLTEENVKVTEERESDMRHETDDAMTRLVELRRKFKALYTAYRDLRYRVEDQWPQPGQPPEVVSEEEVVGGTLEGLIRSEEEADRRTINRLRDQVAQLQGQLEGMRAARAVHEAGLDGRAGPGSGGGAAANSSRAQGWDAGLAAGAGAAGSGGVPGYESGFGPGGEAGLGQGLGPGSGGGYGQQAPPPPPQYGAPPPPDPGQEAENQRLRQEVEQLRRQVQAVAEIPPSLEVENQRLRGELENLKRKLQAVSDPALSSAKGATFSMPPNNSNAANEGIIRQLREFSQKTTSDLQRRLQQAETRATMAEEQLEQLQAYMTKASVTYQKEIMRLRAVVGQMEAKLGAPKGSYLNLDPLDGAGGGGALRPAAEVLGEAATRGSSALRAGGQGGLPSVPRSGAGPRS